MNELENIFEDISEETLSALEKLVDGEATGLETFVGLIQLPDKDFEILRPVFQDSLTKAYKDPGVQRTLLSALDDAGISIEKFISNPSIFSEMLISNEALKDVNQSKKDFVTFLFSSMANALAEARTNLRAMVNIPVELCREGAKLPTYATDGSAAMDIYSPDEYTINPGQTLIIPTGLKVAIPTGYGLLIQPRSGMSVKTKLRVANSPGLIDEDYHEEIGVIIENIDPPIKEANIVTLGDGSIEDANLYGSSFTIGKGERFAQMRLVAVPQIIWTEVDSLGEYDSEHQGFGSTGTH